MHYLSPVIIFTCQSHKTGGSRKLEKFVKRENVFWYEWIKELGSNRFTDHVSVTASAPNWNQNIINISSSAMFSHLPLLMTFTFTFTQIYFNFTNILSYILIHPQILTHFSLVFSNPSHLISTLDTHSISSCEIFTISLKHSSITNLLICPVSVVQGTNISRFQPPRNAVQMEGMIASPPSGNTLLVALIQRVWLAFDTRFHQVISTDCTCLNNNIPQPECNRRPFLDLELLLDGVFLGGFGCWRLYDWG